MSSDKREDLCLCRGSDDSMSNPGVYILCPALHRQLFDGYGEGT